MKLRCVVERITYQNPDNGYSILKVKVKNYPDLVTLVGNLLDVNVGSVLLVEGNWKVDKRYGSQFIAQSWEETMPASLYGMEKYLGSGLIRGVGPVFAKRIVQKFGLDTINVIEDDIDRLYEVSGIGTKRVSVIRESWEKQKEIKNVMLFLQSNGVSTAFAAKIFKFYGKESIQKIKENPYHLADDIWGIGFKTADKIASELGIKSDDFVRIRSGIFYTLGQLSDEGNVFATPDQLHKSATEILKVPKESISETVSKMILSKDLIEEDGSIYLPPFYYAEVGVVNRLKDLISPKSIELQFPVDISSIERATGCKYDEIQASAIQLAVTSKVMILTGGPGTGKTTTTKGIIEALKSKGLKIVLSAPTGRAAKRMTEATLMEATTIHSLLECRPPEGFKRNEENPISGDVLIVDEFSMVDILLMNSLLKALPTHMRLIMVGDVDQLPSVGAGNVLRDLIESGKIPVIKLTKIFRQAQTSRIITNAHRINHGFSPDLSNGYNSDFFFIEKEDPEEVVSLISDLVSKRLPRKYNVRSSEIQVITPMKRGIVGASNLNITLQSFLNPTDLELRRGGFSFRKGDKVMQIRNNYDKNVFNGDIGVITEVDKEDRTLMVNYGSGTVDYDYTELDEITLAYATTVHKSQGSEYPIVIIPVLMTHFPMLQRNLVYTAVTRAKKICVMVGSKKALKYSISNNIVTKRNTMLSSRIANSL